MSSLKPSTVVPGTWQALNANNEERWLEQYI